MRIDIIQPLKQPFGRLVRIETGPDPVCLDCSNEYLTRRSHRIPIANPEIDYFEIWALLSWDFFHKKQKCDS
jgi:hypothetical protein